MKRASLLFLVFSSSCWSQIDTNQLEEVVVSSNRSVETKKSAVTNISILSEKQLSNTLSANLSEGLQFVPGVRVETNCQTCNFTQLRMNGLAGSYTQIVINGRPLFSSLMGLYGLDQLPSNAIERVEVVRGGGSVLYGMNAIAGTVNLITKIPEKNAISLTQYAQLINGESPDVQTQVNASVKTKGLVSGIQFFGNFRKRDWWDANNDGYSEISRLGGGCAGVTLSQSIGKRFSIKGLAWYIDEERRGGNAFDRDPEMADQAEYRKQRTGVADVQVYLRPSQKPLLFMAYFGGQLTDRKHYTGIDQAPGWGTTKANSAVAGLQVHGNRTFNQISTRNVMGFEWQQEYVNDAIPAYNYLIDQQIQTLSFLGQTEILWKKWTLHQGLRIISQMQHSEIPILPRTALKLALNGQWAIRFSYAQGWKAPQAFETDLHIAFSGGGISTIQLDSALRSERSHAFNFSTTWNRRWKNNLFDYTGGFFFNALKHAFVLEEIGQDSLGNTTLLRTNGSPATVYGFSLDTRTLLAANYQIDLGLTFQQAFYQKGIAWSNEVPTITRFLRTPNVYSYANVTFFPEKTWSGTLASSFTGSMLVPHFGGSASQQTDVLEKTNPFYDLTVRIERKWHLHRWKQNLKLGAGVQNIFNAYQQDFDLGKERDSNYIYGPAKPRTFILRLTWYAGE